MKWLKIDNNELINVWQIVRVEVFKSDGKWVNGTFKPSFYIKISLSNNESREIDFDTNEMMREAQNLLIKMLTEGDKVIFNNNKPT